MSVGFSVAAFVVVEKKRIKTVIPLVKKRVKVGREGDEKKQAKIQRGRKR